MGQRGPAKTPTKIRQLRGETRPSRINAEEPQPMPALNLDAPVDITETAQLVWRDTVAALHSTGVLTAADLETLRCYAEATARYRESSALLAKSGPLIRGRDGELVKNPLHQIVRDNATLMRAYARELGLTPASRAGLRGNDGGSGWQAIEGLASLMNEAPEPMKRIS